MLGKRKEAPLEFLDCSPWSPAYHGGMIKSHLPRDVWRLISTFVEAGECGGITLNVYEKRELEEEELLNVSPLARADVQDKQKIEARQRVNQRVERIKERCAVTAAL